MILSLEYSKRLWNADDRVSRLESDRVKVGMTAGWYGGVGYIFELFSDIPRFADLLFFHHSFRNVQGRFPNNILKPP